MKYTIIGLSLAISLSYILAAPTGSLAIPTVGEDINAIAQGFIAFFGTLVFDNVPESVISKLLPILSLDLNLDIVEPFTGGTIPNYGSQFQVDGVENSRIKWFTEAENRTASDPVIIYSHGGGFDIGLWPFHVDFTRVLYERVANPRLSILILDYYLSSKAQYPTQLVQLTDVFNELSQTSDNIWLMGDSAGGSLSIEFLRNRKYPVDGVPRPTDKEIQGLIFISPWVNLHPKKTGTYVTNYGKDVLTAYALSGMGELYEPDISILESDALNPYKDTIDWDDILPDHSKIFVSKGGHEVLKGDIETFVKNANLDDATVYTEPNGIHDSITFDASVNPITPVLVDFLKEAL